MYSSGCWKARKLRSSSVSFGRLQSPCGSSACHCRWLALLALMCRAAACKSMDRLVRVLILQATVQLCKDRQHSNSCRCPCRRALKMPAAQMKALFGFTVLLHIVCF